MLIAQYLSKKLKYLQRNFIERALHRFSVVLTLSDLRVVQVPTLPTMQLVDECVILVIANVVSSRWPEAEMSSLLFVKSTPPDLFHSQTCSLQL